MPPSASAPLLLRYDGRPRAAPPAGPGLQCPPELERFLSANGLELCHETVTDGNCGVHAFWLSLHDTCKRYPALARTFAVKKASGCASKGLRASQLKRHFSSG